MVRVFLFLPYGKQGRDQSTRTRKNPLPSDAGIKIVTSVKLSRFIWFTVIWLRSQGVLKEVPLVMAGRGIQFFR